MTAIERIRDFALSNKCEVRENEPLCGYTTFRIGGPARLMLFPETQEMFTAILKICKSEGVAPFILGNGSNLLISDAGLSGVTLCTEKLDFCKVDGTVIECGSGLLLSKLCVTAQKHSLSGLAFAYGIPGTVGGAVYMNAGAYGGEVKDVITSCVVADINGDTFSLSGDELGFEYRNSAVQRKGLIVLSAAFSLSDGDAEQIRQEMNETMEKRKSKQPLNFPSAGSAFKRPEGYFAGALIEQCGLKGFHIGDAEVSEKHAGFIINKGKATARDVLALSEHIREIVLKETGVLLESEIKYISD